MLSILTRGCGAEQGRPHAGGPFSRRIHRHLRAKLCTLSGGAGWRLPSCECGSGCFFFFLCRLHTITTLNNLPLISGIFFFFASFLKPLRTLHMSCQYLPSSPFLSQVHPPLSLPSHTHINTPVRKPKGSVVVV